jgi:hypothetical protein
VRNLFSQRNPSGKVMQLGVQQLFILHRIAAAVAKNEAWPCKGVARSAWADRVALSMHKHGLVHMTMARDFEGAGNVMGPWRPFFSLTDFGRTVVQSTKAPAASELKSNAKTARQSRHIEASMVAKREEILRNAENEAHGAGERAAAEREACGWLEVEDAAFAGTLEIAEQVAEGLKTYHEGMYRAWLMLSFMGGWYSQKAAMRRKEGF